MKREPRRDTYIFRVRYKNGEETEEEHYQMTLKEANDFGKKLSEVPTIDRVMYLRIDKVNCWKNGKFAFWTTPEPEIQK